MYPDPHSQVGILGLLISMEPSDLRTLDITHQLALLQELFASTVARQDTIVVNVEFLEESEVVRPQHLLADFSSKELRRMDQPRRLAEFISLVLTKSQMASPLCRVCF